MNCRPCASGIQISNLIFAEEVLISPLFTRRLLTVEPLITSWVCESESKQGHRANTPWSAQWRASFKLHQGTFFAFRNVILGLYERDCVNCCLALLANIIYTCIKFLCDPRIFRFDRGSNLRLLLYAMGQIWFDKCLHHALEDRYTFYSAGLFITNIIHCTSTSLDFIVKYG